MSRLEFHNTATGSKDPFEPLDPRKVRMYLCGPTVYDRAHIGNARPAVVFDVLYRLLREVYCAPNVVYVRNITDVDDKINARAIEWSKAGDDRTLQEIVRAITDETIAWYHEDMAALSVLPPDHEPRATEYIPQMIRLVSQLLDLGTAYEAQGHVLFSVDCYEDYGKLGRRSLEDMIAGARVEVAPYKKNPTDFVLWKPSSDEEPGWESPWGRGRPGWHIECSAMSLELLGESFDIHAGGADLIFPHHENEIAQSNCANPHAEFARYWLHNGYLRVEGQKMAKSLGNFLTVKDLRDQGVDGSAIRLALLSTHYRHPLDWTERRLQECSRTIERWRRLVEDADASNLVHGEASSAVVGALMDDLNTPAAIAELHRLAKVKDIRTLKASVDFLGLLGGPQASEGTTADDHARALIERLLGERSAARKRREFVAADQIRDRLLGAGVEIKDGPEGTDWRLSQFFDPGKLQAMQAEAGQGQAGAGR